MYMAKNEIFLHFASKSEGFEEFVVFGSEDSGNEDEGSGGWIGWWWRGVFECFFF